MTAVRLRLRAVQCREGMKYNLMEALGALLYIGQNIC